MQAEKISKIFKRAGGNKAVQGGIFSNINSKKIMRNGKISKINKHAEGNKALQVENFQKIN